MMTEVRPLSEELIQEVKGLIEKKDTEALARRIDEMQPADVADLIEHLDHDERLFIFQVLEPEGAGEVLVEIEPPVQGRLLEDLDDEALSEIVQELESDDAADVIGDLPAERARAIIQTLRGDVSEEIEKLLPYPEDTAGGIMGLEFVAVRADATVKEAIDVIRQKADEVENLYYLWVVDINNRLVGVISLKDLLLEPHDRKISEIMNPNVISVNVNADQEEVVHLVKKYDLVNIPVVDDQNRLVGRITHDDVIDVIEDEVDEDMTRIAGVIDQEITEDSPLKISRARLPWLIGGIFGELISALVISRFESSLEKVIALSFFFPVIMAMGGNTGQQAAIIVVRGLATGDISLMRTGKRLLTEMKVAFGNGIICGVLLGLIVGTWLSNYELGAVVALALLMVMLNAGFIGSAVPLAFKRIGVDPALATGPFVSTSNDILGLLIYLLFVTFYLRMAT
ncbi:MAG: magnesium transporter [Deltaproteobacteria bacterium]|nr:magnesium transporter [Deltaproteobacteria bacterium]MBW1928385.1 magnesium transporter [Deltaproteobacteria bacterium]MBW2023816.1 magnesium transporter [Deltaproteobacteria bacterium]MBW2124571.1 magnesium transporter [Deltaproteobacteria bacterium]RLB23581.1 MAG: magnesium transporter [Deltaproteobacteria bacterium]